MQHHTHSGPRTESLKQTGSASEPESPCVHCEPRAPYTHREMLPEPAHLSTPEPWSLADIEAKELHHSKAKGNVKSDSRDTGITSGDPDAAVVKPRDSDRGISLVPLACLICLLQRHTGRKGRQAKDCSQLHTYSLTYTGRQQAGKGEDHRRNQNVALISTTQRLLPLANLKK